MSRDTKLEVKRCPRGCEGFFAVADHCPNCNAETAAVRIDPHARLVLTTTVRVNPSGEPFVLGIAQTRAGRTLCHVEGRVRNGGHDLVSLTVRDGRFVARKR